MQVFELSPRGLRLTCDVFHGQPSGGTPGVEQPHQFLALNCRYEGSPSVRLALPLLKRDRIEDYDPEGRYDAGDVNGEAQYERKWSSETMSEHLRGIDAFSMSDANRTSNTITLARYRFLYPPSRDWVHVVMANSGISKFAIRGIDDEMLQIHPGRSGGTLTSNPLNFVSNEAGLYHSSDVFIQVDDCPTRNCPPPLSVSYGLGGVQISFKTGETKILMAHKLSDPKLAISAHYVNRAGELLWSLSIEAVESERALSYRPLVSV
jgi:hypothetical protein